MKEIKWRNVLEEDIPIYAHRKNDNEKETLEEHIVRCEKYLNKIWKEKKIETILDNIYNQFFQEKNLKPFFIELFQSAIYFHDMGKLNPKFQWEKMNNERFKDYKLEGLSGSSHSFLSAVIYLDYYTYLLENKEFRRDINCTKQEMKMMEVFVLIGTYAIMKHHGDLDQIEKLIEELDSPNTGVLLNELQREKLKGYKGLQYFNEKNYKRKINFYLGYKQDNFCQEQDIICVLYLRLLYSTLVTCDYYSTTEYISEVECNDFESALNLSSLKEIYNNSKLIKEIRKYEREMQIPGIEKSSDRAINSLRCEMFIEAEKNLKKEWGENIYFLEAPTGAGKSNIAMNLSFSLLKEKKKIIYIYPFNTLVDQNLINLYKIFGKEKVEKYITVVNSITPIKVDRTINEDSKEYYTKALLDRQFLNYPFLLSTHVTFFNTLFGNKQEDLFGFLQLSNSIVVLDEIQSYKIDIWAEIITLLQVYAKIMEIKIIIMSATLPQLSILDSHNRKVVNLIKNREVYFLNPIFKNRVKISYELLDRGIDIDVLFFHVKKSSMKKKKILVTFINKKTANKFYQKLKEDEEIKSQVELITGYDSSYEREKILEPIKSGKVTDIILVTTQVVEAGVDIDMDIGYKNIGKMDSDEQFLGRINRSNQNKEGIVYFFNIDAPKSIYKGDYRVGDDVTLKNEEIRKLLVNKDFSAYYKTILNFILKEKSSARQDGYRNFFDTVVKNLKLKELSEHMKLIEENEYETSIVLCRNIKFEDGTNLNGWEIWEQYKEILENRTMDFVEKQVKLSYIRSKLSYFIYSISMRNGVVNYSDKIGELYCIFDGESYFKNGKLDVEQLTGEKISFI